MIEWQMGWFPSRGLFYPTMRKKLTGCTVHINHVYSMGHTTLLQGQNQVQGPTSGQYTNSADVTGDRKIFQEVQQYARSLIGNFLHVSWSVMMLPLLFSRNRDGPLQGYE